MRSGKLVSSLFGKPEDCHFVNFIKKHKVDLIKYTMIFMHQESICIAFIHYIELVDLVNGVIIARVLLLLQFDLKASRSFICATTEQK